MLTEAQRMSSVAPFVAPHRAMKDTQLQGYSIPEVPYKSNMNLLLNIHFFIYLGHHGFY